MDNSTQPRTSLFVRCWRVVFRSWAIRILAGLFFLIACFYAEEDLKGKYAWNKYRRQLQAQGIRVDMASVAPPPVPDDQNFAAIPFWQNLFRYETNPVTKKVELSLSHTNLFVPIIKYPPATKEFVESPALGSWQTGLKTEDLAKFQTYFRQTNGDGIYEFPVAEHPQSAGADVLLALSRFDADLNAIRAAAKRPLSRFPILYEYGFQSPHVGKLKWCCQVLQLRSLAELELGQTDRALEDFCLSMRLVESIRTEPVLMSQQQRIKMVTENMQPIWEGLADRRWSDAQLATMDQDLAKLDFLADYQHALRGELAYTVTTIEYLRESKNFESIIPIIHLRSDDDADPDRRFVRWFHLTTMKLGPDGWLDQNALACVRLERGLLSVTDPNQHRAYPEVIEQAMANNPVEFDYWTPYNSVAGLLARGMPYSSPRFAHCQAMVDEARIACAIERYRLANGSYPQTLDALAPKYLNKVPHDVMSGQPFIYKPIPKGQFQLYSVGWNQKDDGGKVEYRGGHIFLHIQEGDWVWPIAADATQQAGK